MALQKFALVGSGTQVLTMGAHLVGTFPGVGQGLNSL